MRGGGNRARQRRRDRGVPLHQGPQLAPAVHRLARDSRHQGDRRAHLLQVRPRADWRPCGRAPDAASTALGPQNPLLVARSLHQLRPPAHAAQLGPQRSSLRRVPRDAAPQPSGAGLLPQGQLLPLRRARLQEVRAVGGVRAPKLQGETHAAAPRGRSRQRHLQLAHPVDRRVAGVGAVTADVQRAPRSRGVAGLLRRQLCGASRADSARVGGRLGRAGQVPQPRGQPRGGPLHGALVGGAPQPAPANQRRQTAAVPPGGQEGAVQRHAPRYGRLERRWVGEHCFTVVKPWGWTRGRLCGLPARRA
uniref:Uncharacterized protein n=1 Tax=Emiliania huxleyi (strain CCMP1516) TaxID=280463 RepID=A0A0D3J9A5_EMIH1